MLMIMTAGAQGRLWNNPDTGRPIILKDGRYVELQNKAVTHYSASITLKKNRYIFTTMNCVRERGVKTAYWYGSGDLYLM
jgi:hypothetical protein